MGKYIILTIIPFIFFACSKKTELVKEKEPRFISLNKKDTKRWLSNNTVTELPSEGLHLTKVYLSEKGQVLVYDESFEDGVVYRDMVELQKVLNITINNEVDPFMKNQNLLKKWDEVVVDSLITNLLSLIESSIEDEKEVEKNLNLISAQLNHLNVGKENYELIFLGCGALLGKYISIKMPVKWIISNKTDMASSFSPPRPVLISSSGTVYDPWFRLGKSLRKDDGQEINLYALYLVHTTIDQFSK